MFERWTVHNCLLVVVLLAVMTQGLSAAPNPIGVVYGNDGKPSVHLTLEKALDFAADPELPPSYSSNNASTLVEAQLVLNNLREISEVQQTVTLDVFLRLYWTDDRLVLDELFDVLPSKLSFEGVELVTMDEPQGYPFWLPDIQIINTVEITENAATIRLKPGGAMYWSRHFVVTIQQTEFLFASFPQDTQEMQIGLESYGLSKAAITFQFREPAVVSRSIDKNRIWEFDGYSARISQTVYVNTYTRTYETGFVSLIFKRRFGSQLIRYILPIILILLYVSLTQFMKIGDRVGAVIDLLLAWSALYFVVSQSLPPVSDITRMDTFMLVGFSFITIVAGVHVASAHCKSQGRTRMLAASDALMRSISVPFVIVSVLACFEWPVAVYVVFSLLAGVYMFAMLYMQRKRFQAPTKKLEEVTEVDSDDWAPNPLKSKRSKAAAHLTSAQAYRNTALLVQHSDGSDSKQSNESRSRGVRVEMAQVGRS